MKAAFTRNVAMSDFFRAFAGAPESQFDAIVTTVYTAAYSLMEAGNKTQFVKLSADAQMYGTDTSDANKLVKEALGIKSLNAAARHFKKTYYALQVAIAHMGMPADMQKELPAGRSEDARAARFAILDPLADAYAQEFASHFVATLSMPEKTEEERAAAAKQAKAKREQKAKATAKELEAKIAEEAAKRAAKLAPAAPVASADDVALAVIDALSTGTLSADVERALIEAVRLRETAVLLALQSSTETETA